MKLQIRSYLEPDIQRIVKQRKKNGANSCPTFVANEMIERGLKQFEKDKKTIGSWWA